MARFPLQRRLEGALLAIFSIALFSSTSVFAGTQPQKKLKEPISQTCFDALRKLPGPTNLNELKMACSQAVQLPGCHSTDGRAIYHFDHIEPKALRRILVFALIHGDETPAATMARAWITRLTRIHSRSSWRIVPILNPDGHHLDTRTNADGVDLNRNFPTKDWKNYAHRYWVDRTHRNPRRYPGKGPASEVETRCAMKEIADFKPDLIVSIHTPLAVLDFDGPKVANPPSFRLIPWRLLSTYPGSLGRYMWINHHEPVLTVEMNGNHILHDYKEYARIQDAVGTLALKITPRSGSLKQAMFRL